MMMTQCPLELIHKTYHIVFSFFFSASTQRGMGSLRFSDFTHGAGEGVTITCFNDTNEGRLSSSRCRHCRHRGALEQGCYHALVFYWAASRCLQKRIKEDITLGRSSPQNVFKSWIKWGKKNSGCYICEQEILLNVTKMRYLIKDVTVHVSLKTEVDLYTSAAGADYWQK